MQYTSVASSSINYSSLTSYVNSSTFTGRPTSVTFYYKYVTDDHQPVKYSFSIFTGDVFNPTIIGLAEVIISETTNGYQKATADFVYSSRYSN